MLTVPVVALAPSAAGESASAEFERSTETCSTFYQESPFPCRLSLVGNIAVLGCAGWTCRFAADVGATAVGLEFGSKVLDVSVGMFAMNWTNLSGGSQPGLICHDSSQGEDLVCEGQAAWAADLAIHECEAIYAHASYVNDQLSAPLFGSPFALQTAGLGAAYEFCRTSETTGTLTAYPLPPPAPARIDLEIDVPAGTFAALRLNFSGPIDMAYNFRSEQCDQGSQHRATANFGAWDGSGGLGSNDGGFHWFPNSPVVSASALGFTVNGDPPETIFTNGCTGAGSSGRFQLDDSLDHQSTRGLVAAGVPAKMWVSIDWTSGITGFDMIRGAAIAKTADDLGGVHATGGVPATAFTFSAGALNNFAFESAHDFLGMWVGNSSSAEYGIREASCSKDGEPCSETNGIAYLASEGPTQWTVGMQYEAKAVVPKQYVLFGVFLPDDILDGTPH